MTKKYHVVVVGGGIGGLSTAIAYAKNADVSSRPILVLEKEPKVGGMVTSFKREGYLFDTVQFVSDVSALLGYYGVDLPLKRFEGNCARIFIADPKKGYAERIEIPTGIGRFKEMLRSGTSKDKEAAVRMVEYSEAMFSELKHLRMKSSLWGNLGMLFRCRKIIRNSDFTFSRYLDEFGVVDPNLREVFDIFAAFGGLPAERVSALFITGVMIATLRGSFRPASGFIKLPHALRKRAEDFGATIRCKARVEKILTRNGTVAGVRLEGGEIIEADYVVAALDTKVAMLDLVGDAVLRNADPAYADKVQQVKMSPSSITVSLGLSDGIDLKRLGMDCGYNVITTGRGTFEEMFKAFDRGETGWSDSRFHTAAVAPFLSADRKPTLIIRIVPVPIADWSAIRSRDPEAYVRRKHEIADFFVEKVERYLIPDLKRHIEVMDIATPATFERYTGTPTGSNYDMSPYPDNFGRNRLGMETPIKGLLLPKLTHSIYGALQAGMYAADAVLEGAILKGRSFL